MRVDPRYIKWIILHRLPLVLVAFALSAAVILSGLSFLPKTYVAQARILVESSDIPDDLATPTVSTGKSEQIEILEHRVMTRANLTALARSTGAISPNQHKTEVVSQLRDSIRFETATGRDNATVLTISTQHLDPEIARIVTSEIARLVIFESARINTERVEDALSFFRSEVAAAKSHLATQTDILQAFRIKHSGHLPEDRPELADRKTQLQDQLFQLDQPRGQSFQKDLEALNQQLANARTIYASKHPKIRMLEAQIKAMTSALGLREPQPMRANIQDELLQIERRMALIPANAIQLVELEREQALSAHQYQDTMARLSQAATSERVEALAKGDRLTLVEPPQTPTHHKGPDRGILALLGLCVALATALGLAFLLVTFDRTIRRPAHLVEGLGLTPFATLPVLKAAN